MKFVSILLLGFFIFNTELPCFAGAFPWIAINANDLKFTNQVHTEAELRLWLIQRAQESIEIATYDHRADEEIGLPILHALREAANRGVKVRFLRGALLSKLHGELSWNDTVKNTLLYPPTATPIRFLLAGSLAMILKGWSPFSGAHEKLLIIDNHYLILTGRGHGKQYIDWLDSCFLIKGKLVEQAKSAFNSLWEVVAAEHGGEGTPPQQENPRPPVIQLTPPLPIAQSDRGFNPELESLKAWLSSSDKVPADPTQIERPTYARLLHHDLLKQMREHCQGVPWIYNYTPCSSKIVDPISEEMTRLILRAQSVKLYSLGTVFPLQIKQAIQKRLLERATRGGRDFQIEIFTNGKIAHKAVLSYPMVWFVGLQDLNDLAHAGAQIYTFSPYKNGKLVFLHRKVAFFKMPDNEESIAIFGSHNFSRASHFITDEMSVEVMNTPLVEQLWSFFNQDTEAYGTPINLEEIRGEHTGWEAWGIRWFGGLIESGI